MKLGTRFAVLFVIAALASAAQYALIQRSHATANQLILRLIPHGQLQYETLWPWFWGAGIIRGISFEPAGLMQLNLHTPDGYLVHLRELRIHRLDPGWIDGMPSVRGRALGLRLPVPDHRSTPLDPSRPLEQGLPTLHELGFADLEFDLDFHARFIPEARLLLLRFDGAGEAIGHFDLAMHLEGSAATFKRAPDQILLRRLELRFTDQGLLQRYRDTAAAQRGVTSTALAQALVSALDRVATSKSWSWDFGSTQALRQGLIRTVNFRARIDPPGQVFLRNIRFYKPRDWGAALGFSLSVNEEASAPIPRGP